MFVLDEYLQAPCRPNHVVIMAGGKGERLKPLTNNCPKPMLHVGDKPILELILKQCIEAGLKKFYFSVNYLKDQIIDYFGDGSKWGVNINYLEENIPLGTAGSLSLITDIPKHDLMVLNGDVMTNIDFDR